MPDDGPEVEWAEEAPPTEEAGEEAETAHDDIMKRLLDYQRSLRDGASPEEAAEAMKRGLAESGSLGEPSAVEGLAELLTTEVEPVESPAPEAEHEAEPVLDLEPESAPEAEPAAAAEAELASEVAVEVQMEEPIEAEAVVPVELEPAFERGPADEAAEPPGGESRAELEARVGSLEGKLDDLGAKIAELRRSFQDMAIAADERLATMADEVERARREQQQEE